MQLYIEVKVPSVGGERNSPAAATQENSMARGRLNAGWRWAGAHWERGRNCAGFKAFVRVVTGVTRPATKRRAGLTRAFVVIAF